MPHVSSNPRVFLGQSVGSGRLVRRLVALTFAIALPAVTWAQTAVGQGVPALRVTAPNGASNILIGSFHIPVDGLRQPAASVFNGIQRYVIEGLPDANAPSALARLAPEVEQGRSVRADWSKALTDAQIHLMREQARCTGAGLDVDAALRYASTESAGFIAMCHCASAGLLSRDVLLSAAAYAHGLPPSVLETPAQVDKQRAAVPERIYQYALFRAFTPRSWQEQRRAANALDRGVYDEILQALRDLAANAADANIFYELMVADRNRSWMPTLMRYLDEGNAFVNVGAAHLPGPKGLVALLRETGYKVEPISLPQDGAQGG
jgi:uncharacterized protein